MGGTAWGQRSVGDTEFSAVPFHADGNIVQKTFAEVSKSIRGELQQR